jgi:hypothetical protein
MKPYLKFFNLILVLCLGFLFTIGCLKDEIVAPDAAIDQRESPTASGLGPDSTAKFYGVSMDNQLITYTVGPPAQEKTATPITGLKEPDERIVTIDMNPKNGLLYGVSNKGRLYTIDPATAAATPVSTSAFNPMPTGNIYGMDFNSKTGLFRLVTNTGDNMTVSPTTGTITSVDQKLTPSSTVINSVAYLNGTSSSPTASMFDISITDGKVYVQDESKGTLRAVGSTTLMIQDEGGFDISKDNRYGLAVLNAGALYKDPSDPQGLNTATAYRLYHIDLSTGKATSFGSVRPMSGMTIAN